MGNESWVQARLESAVFASLVQVVELTVPSVSADVGAGRVFDTALTIAPSYVSAGRLGLRQRQEPAVHDWPMEERSVFEQLRGRTPRDGAFQLGDVLDGQAQRRDLFGPIATHQPIVDTLAAAFPVEAGAWCLLILFRCGDSMPFERPDIQRLDGLRQGLATALRRGYRQDQEVLRAAAGDRLAGSDGPFAPSSHSTPALLARLSRTERRVLSYLRSRYTERQIAERMERSPHTIHVHVKNIYRKFAVCSRRELIALFEKQ